MSALLALLFAAAIALLATREPGGGERALGSALATKLRCAAELEDVCRPDPLSEAYGRPLAGWVRSVAPAPALRAGPGGVGMVGVDFRYCRNMSCAIPVAGAGGMRLTASNRRTTAFVALSDERRSSGTVRADFWIYRPLLGWERIIRTASSAQVAAAASTPLVDSADPKLVPLETLAGRNHIRFRADEEPPWRWRVG